MSHLTDDDRIDENKLLNATDGVPIHTPRRIADTGPYRRTWADAWRDICADDLIKEARWAEMDAADAAAKATKTNPQD